MVGGPKKDEEKRIRPAEPIKTSPGIYEQGSLNQQIPSTVLEGRKAAFQTQFLRPGTKNATKAAFEENFVGAAETMASVSPLRVKDRMLARANEAELAAAGIGNFEVKKRLDAARKRELTVEKKGVLSLCESRAAAFGKEAIKNCREARNTVLHTERDTRDGRFEAGREAFLRARDPRATDAERKEAETRFQAAAWGALGKSALNLDSAEEELSTRLGERYVGATQAEERARIGAAYAARLGTSGAAEAQRQWEEASEERLRVEAELREYFMKAGPAGEEPWRQVTVSPVAEALAGYREARSVSPAPGSPSMDASALALRDALSQTLGAEGAEALLGALAKSSPDAYAEQDRLVHPAMVLEQGVPMAELAWERTRKAAQEVSLGQMYDRSLEVRWAAGAERSERAVTLLKAEAGREAQALSDWKARWEVTRDPGDHRPQTPTLDTLAATQGHPALPVEEAWGRIQDRLTVLYTDPNALTFKGSPYISEASARHLFGPDWAMWERGQRGGRTPGQTLDEQGNLDQFESLHWLGATPEGKEGKAWSGVIEKLNQAQGVNPEMNPALVQISVLKDEVALDVLAQHREERMLGFWKGEQTRAEASLLEALGQVPDLKGEALAKVVAQAKEDQPGLRRQVAKLAPVAAALGEAEGEAPRDEAVLLRELGYAENLQGEERTLALKQAIQTAEPLRAQHDRGEAILKALATLEKVETGRETSMGGQWLDHEGEGKLVVAKMVEAHGELLAQGKLDDSLEVEDKQVLSARDQAAAGVVLSWAKGTPDFRDWVLANGQAGCDLSAQELKLLALANHRYQVALAAKEEWAVKMAAGGPLDDQSVQGLLLGVGVSTSGTQRRLLLTGLAKPGLGPLPGGAESALAFAKDNAEKAMRERVAADKIANLDLDNLGDRVKFWRALDYNTMEAMAKGGWEKFRKGSEDAWFRTKAMWNSEEASYARMAGVMGFHSAVGIGKVAYGLGSGAANMAQSLVHGLMALARAQEMAGSHHQADITGAAGQVFEGSMGLGKGAVGAATSGVQAVNQALQTGQALRDAPHRVRERIARSLELHRKRYATIMKLNQDASQRSQEAHDFLLSYSNSFQNAAEMARASAEAPPAESAAKASDLAAARGIMMADFNRLRTASPELAAMFEHGGMLDPKTLDESLDKIANSVPARYGHVYENGKSLGLFEEERDENGKLRIMATGDSGPVLDLGRLKGGTDLALRVADGHLLFAQYEVNEKGGVNLSGRVTMPPAFPLGKWVEYGSAWASLQKADKDPSRDLPPGLPEKDLALWQTYQQVRGMGLSDGQIEGVAHLDRFVGNLGGSLRRFDAHNPEHERCQAMINASLHKDHPEGLGLMTRPEVAYKEYTERILKQIKIAGRRTVTELENYQNKVILDQGASLDLEIADAMAANDAAFGEG